MRWTGSPCASSSCWSAPRPLPVPTSRRSAASRAWCARSPSASGSCPPVTRMTSTARCARQKARTRCRAWSRRLRPQNPMSHSLPTTLRSSLAGTLRREDAGGPVRLAGWVHRRRDLGGLVFVELRDRSGRVQLSFGPDWTPADVLERAGRLGTEAVIAIEGDVVERPAANVNPEMPTGEIEVHVRSLEVLSEAESPPIPVAYGPGEELPAEELRLRYRYLDLRREPLQRALGIRHRALQLVRRHLSAEGFWEIETPMLTRRTPE